MNVTPENVRDKSSTAHAVAAESAEELVSVGEGCGSPPLSPREIAWIKKQRRSVATKKKRRMATIARELGPWPA